MHVAPTKLRAFKQDGDEHEQHEGDARHEMLPCRVDADAKDVPHDEAHHRANLNGQQTSRNRHGHGNVMTKLTRSEQRPQRHEEELVAQRVHAPSHVPEHLIGEEHVRHGHKRQRNTEHELPRIELEGKRRQERKPRGENRAEDNTEARDAIQLLRHDLKAGIDEAVGETENKGETGKHEECSVVQKGTQRRARGFGKHRRGRISSRNVGGLNARCGLGRRSNSCRIGRPLFILIRQTHGVRGGTLPRPETNTGAHKAHHQGKHRRHDVAHEECNAAEQKGNGVVEQGRAHTQGGRLRAPLAQQQALSQTCEKA